MAFGYWRVNQQNVLTLLVILLLLDAGWFAHAQTKSADSTTTGTVIGGSAKNGGQGQGRAVGAKGRFLSKTKIVAAEVREKEVAELAKKTMKEETSNASSGEKQGPETIEEAAALISHNVSMSCPPSKCFEYDGMFYFSGGTSAKPIDDFSSGFAVRKGSNAIYRWESLDPPKDLSKK